jgi:hypothetical protein
MQRREFGRGVDGMSKFIPIFAGLSRESIGYRTRRCRGRLSFEVGTDPPGRGGARGHQQVLPIVIDHKRDAGIPNGEASVSQTLVRASCA